jgi:hypothetical protein
VLANLLDCRLDHTGADPPRRRCEQTENSRCLLLRAAFDIVRARLEKVDLPRQASDNKLKSLIVLIVAVCRERA